MNPDLRCLVIDGSSYRTTSKTGCGWKVFRRVLNYFFKLVSAGLNTQYLESNSSLVLGNANCSEPKAIGQRMKVV